MTSGKGIRVKKLTRDEIVEIFYSDKEIEEAYRDWDLARIEKKELYRIYVNKILSLIGYDSTEEKMNFTATVNCIYVEAHCPYLMDKHDCIDCVYNSTREGKDKKVG